MATTSLWHIKGRLKDLIDYVENPEKTKAKTPELQDLYNVFSYVQRPEATQEGEYVTALNRLKETALRQMILTKKRYGNTDGYIAWHGYQSFKPEEVTPQLDHEIGVKLAKEMWGGRFEIIVTTHLDKEHIHCHFCFNSVSFRDGGKYNYSKTEQQRLREVSDRLCREYGLSVIEKPHKAPSRPVWLDEKSGKPTRYNVYRADVQEAMDFSRTPYYMEDYGNMPLIEPLEYKEVKRIREFVVAIDTSGSVSGELVQKFVQKTYNILKQQESFFAKINLHILQCDAEVQEDAKITSQEEFDAYLNTMQLRGFGGTDFRPVFDYVEQLRQAGEFTNLKGLIYFTDGFGTFPERRPDYHTAFVFIDDEYNNPDVPVWAIKLVLQKDEI